MTDGRTNMLLAAALFTIVLAVYGQTIGFDFVNYDDHRYVHQQPRVMEGITSGNIVWAFTTFEFSNWHPLTWLSYMIDSTIFGEEPRGFHLTNIVLHALNAGLLMIVLMRMTGSPWRSALVSALFALHPLHVESVAWVSSRKDVLSAFFGLLAMLAYIRFCQARARTDSPSRGVAAYLMLIVCLTLSLMSKPTLVTLPFVLLLLDWWPLNRLRSLREFIPRLIEKLPLIAMSIASSIITIAAQASGGAMRDLEQLGITQRLGHSIIAYGVYLRQTIWPSDLAVFYPYPSAMDAETIALASVVLLTFTFAAVVAAKRVSRAPLVGWLWYLGTLVPMIGLVQVGAAAHADRYTYFPLIGVFIMVAWMLPASSPDAVKRSAIASATALLALTAVCWFQIGYWRDSVTLAARALSVTQDNWMAHTLMGEALTSVGEIESAIAHLEEATRIEPGSPQTWHNLGYAYAQATMNTKAIDAYRSAIALRPDFAENHYNLGLLLAADGKLGEARQSLQRAIDLAERAGDATLSTRASLALDLHSPP